MQADEVPLIDFSEPRGSEHEEAGGANEGGSTHAGAAEETSSIDGGGMEDLEKALEALGGVGKAGEMGGNAGGGEGDVDLDDLLANVGSSF